MEDGAEEDGSGIEAERDDDKSGAEEAGTEEEDRKSGEDIKTD